MAVQTLSRVNIQRLDQARRNGVKRLIPYRQKRIEMIEQYAGRNYANNMSVDRVPVNMMELLVNVLRRHLVSRRPNVRVSTPYQQLKPIASDLGLGMHYLLDHIDFGESMQWCVLDAMFGPGIMKVAVCGDAGAFYGGTAHMHGVPYADPVDLDDWVHDPRARRFEEITFCGNRYTTTRQQLMDSQLFSEDEIDKLEIYRHDGLDEYGTPRASDAGGKVDWTEEGVTDYFQFWDIWVPGEGKIYTFQENGDRIIRTVDWDGPVHGPYHMLRFGRVSGNIMPLTPGATMLDLQTSITSLYRKAIRQALRQKKLTGFASGSEEDAQRVRDASDGEMVRMDNPDKVKEIPYGGADQVTLAMAIHLKDVFSYQAGNLDALGGLSAQSGTLGQDELLTASANKRLADMQDEVAKFTQKIVQDIAWYLWSDESVSLPLVKRVKDYEVPFTFDQNRKSGEFFHYNFQIDPYSMRYVSPAQKSALLDALLQQLAPFMPMAMQQGVVFDPIEYINLKAELHDFPELKRVLKFMGRQSEQPVGTEQETAKSPMTKRTYERVNKSEATRSGKDRDLVGTLLGKKMQGAEAV